MGKEVGQCWIWMDLGKCTEGRGPILEQCVQPGSCASTIYLWFYSASVRVWFRQYQSVTRRPPLPVKIMLSALMLIVWLVSLKTVLKRLCCRVPSYGGVGCLLCVLSDYHCLRCIAQERIMSLNHFLCLSDLVCWQRTPWCLLGLMIQKQECGGLLSWPHRCGRNMGSLLAG